MRILGIDPGYERLGIAILDSIAREQREEKNSKQHVVVFSECFRTSSKLDFPKRLYLIGEKVQKIIKKYKPKVLAIETLFLNTNQKTAMHVAEVRGATLYEAVRAKLEIFEATPLQIKIATTSYGRANKEQVMKMVKILVGIDNSKKSDDELDAVAVALTALAHKRL